MQPLNGTHWHPLHLYQSDIDICVLLTYWTEASEEDVARLEIQWNNLTYDRREKDRVMNMRVMSA